MSSRDGGSFTRLHNSGLEQSPPHQHQRHHHRGGGGGGQGQRRQQQHPNGRQSDLEGGQQQGEHEHEEDEDDEEELPEASSSLRVRFSSRFLRVFLIMTGFDALFELLLFVVVAKTESVSASDFFNQQAVHFKFATSVFDVMMLASARLFVLLLTFVIAKPHGSIVAVTTLASTAYLLAKVFYYSFSSSDPGEYILLIVAFVMPWLQAWMWAARAFRNRSNKRQAALAASLNETASLLNNSYGVATYAPQSSSRYGTAPVFREIEKSPAYATRFGQHEDETTAQLPGLSREETPFRTPPELDEQSIADEETKSLMDQAAPNSASLAVPVFSGPPSKRPSIVGTYSQPNPKARHIPPNLVRDAEYRRLAVEALDLMWSYSISNDGWTLSSDKNESQIYWRNSPTVVLFKSVTVLDVSPTALFELLFYNIENHPSWNENVTDYHVIYKIDDYTDVTLTQTNKAVGGMVLPRDFINVRQWRRIGNSYMGAGKSIILDEYPERPDVVRGWNEAGGWAMLEIPNKPHLSCLVWVINTDLRGNLSKWIINQTMSGAMRAFVVGLKKRLQQQQQARA
ncbi:hypothetical protein CAOG_07933 [Capsaspora owczarzaki ATCC 30864]|uniref:START domain-containing protein n=1 Tax=Capsaspora owczarzaki (strain ATCC 30864) TaxID=595528 RepID=A0A0D2USA6_CAPO3|nr:hypothetical protein CAOG_07933 [Capsaspora owczarzaki ATCC 30864]KJE97851.1 hypothetical protein CAOG_007933 [Capsaspora owczarzaki ATCC 30864]|eukprot:XP_004343020.1 hypothetical protein CAOG_07933 [Capsaspora owczarzaki ATCC 30864]